MFRVNGAQVGDTLPTLAGAEEFKKLVEQHGGAAARAILAARNTDQHSVLLRDWMTDHIDSIWDFIVLGGGTLVASCLILWWFFRRTGMLDDGPARRSRAT